MFVINQFPVTASDEFVDIRALVRRICTFFQWLTAAIRLFAVINRAVPVTFKTVKPGASIQAMRLDDDCHPIDSVEVVLFVWTNVRLNHARVGEVRDGPHLVNYMKGNRHD